MTSPRDGIGRASFTSNDPRENPAGSLANTHRQLKKRKPKKNKKKEKNQFIHFAHENWNLVLHMLFGIR